MRPAARRLARRLAFAGVLFLAGAAAQTTAPQAEPPARARLERAETLYRLHCAVCHGETGLGYAEAKRAFPPDHRRCERCHRPGNPAVMALEDIRNDHDLFSLGHPPALRGRAASAPFPDVRGLAAYLQAAMPRYEPGRLTGEEYALLAELLLSWR